MEKMLCLHDRKRTLYRSSIRLLLQMLYRWSGEKM